jgi:hypothetical protein
MDAIAEVKLLTASFSAEFGSRGGAQINVVTKSGTLGGPVWIPGKWNMDKSKLFFFASEEWKYVHQATTNLDTVPTQAARSGNFLNSGLAAPVDPATGAPFPNQVVPQSRFSHNGPLLLNPYPQPNYSASGGNYVVNGINRTDTRGDIYRVDYNLSQTTQIMYRWTADTWYIFNPYPRRESRDRSWHPLASWLQHNPNGDPSVFAHNAEFRQL